MQVPAFLLLGIWFLSRLYFGAAGLADAPGRRRGVAYFAHVGGFVFGLALVRLFAARRTTAPGPVY